MPVSSRQNDYKLLMQIRANRLSRQAKPVETKETLRILIPPFPGSNPGTPANFISAARRRQLDIGEKRRNDKQKLFRRVPIRTA